jgi:hypothetical protein
LRSINVFAEKPVRSPPHRSRHVANGEIAGDPVAIVGNLVHARAPKHEVRKVLRIQEVGRTQVIVALRFLCVDTGRVNLHLDGRCRRICLIN